MKEAMHREGTDVVDHQGISRVKRLFRKRPARCCTVCSRHIWLRPVHMMEPLGVPEPRRSWVLCKDCYQALVVEMRRSPVLSPLRLRIAIGIIAAERWPQAYPTRVSTYNSDRRWVVFIAASMIIFIILHLVIMVWIGTLFH